MASSNKLNLAITVNGQEVETTLTNLNKSFYKLRNSVNKLEEGTDEWIAANRELAKVEKERERQIKVQKEYREEIKKTIEAQEESVKVLGEFGDNVGIAFASLKSGDMVAFQSAWKGVTENIRYATKAALTFIATPIGAALAVLAGIAAASKMWSDYNAEAREANEVTAQLTQLSGQALDDARIRAGVIEETFGTDFKESLEVAKKLVEGFGVSYGEAFDVIEDGLIRGGKENSEFLKSLNEYPKLFAQAGFSIKDFQNIVNTGIDLGVYDDKLPDAIKEFSLSVMEQTTSSKDALENAFGKKFTGDLFKGINDGSITVKQALQQVASEAQKIGLNAQESQQLTADLFRGAGEDAGGAKLIFEAVNKSLNEQQRELSELETFLKRTADANRELAEAQDKALKSDSYAQMSNDASVAWTKVKTLFFEGINFIIQAFNSSSEFIATKFVQIGVVIGSLPNIVKKAGTEMIKEIKDVVSTFGILGDVVSKILDFDFEGAKASAKEFKNAFTKEVGDVKDVATGVADEIVKVYDDAGKKLADFYEKRRKVAGEALVTETETGTTPGNKPPKITDEEQKAAEAAAKKAAAEEQKRLDAIDKLRETYKKKEEDRQDDTELKRIERAKQRALAEAEELKAGEDVKQQIIDEYEAQKTAKLEELQLARAAKEKEIDDEIQTLKDEEELQRELDAADTKLEKDELKLEAARNLALRELGIQEELEIAKLKLVDGNEALIQKLREKYALEKGKMNREFNKQEKALRTDQVDWTELTEKEKLNIIQGALGAAAEAFNEGSGAWKAIKIAETLITTYQSAQNAFNSLSGIPIVGPALGAVAAGLAVVAGISRVNKIASTPIAKMKKPNKSFARGGFTDNAGQGYRDETGHEVAGVVHKNEYVVPEFVRRDPEVPQILDYLEGKRKRKLGLYAAGGDTGKDTEFPTPSNNGRAADAYLADAVYRLVAKLEEPIYATTLYDTEAALARQTVDKKLTKIQENSKIKKA